MTKVKIRGPGTVCCTLLIIVVAAAVSVIVRCSSPGMTGAGGLPSRTAFPLPYTGSEYLVDYSKYGEFVDAGTPVYRYRIRDIYGLGRATGEGVYPNSDFIKADPRYVELKKKGMLAGSHWDKKSSHEAEFYSWATAGEDWGVRQYFTAKALQESGHLLQAVKAYYAVIVHFPRSICYFKNSTSFWYVAEAARLELEKIAALNPALGLSLENITITTTSEKGVLLSPGALKSAWVGKINPSGVPAEFRIVDDKDTSLLAENLELIDFGIDQPDYQKYGTFTGADGSVPFHYMLKDTAGLAAALGEGMLPANRSIVSNPQYQRFKKAGWLDNNQWDNWARGSNALSFYSIATAAEDPGRRLFFIAEVLKEAALKQNDARLARQSIKAYYAVLVLFPGKEAYAPDNAFLWYIAPAAITKMKYLMERFPELDAGLEPTYLRIANGYDFSAANDTVYLELGKIVQREAPAPAPLAEGVAVEKRGAGTVRLERLENGNWRLMVEGAPFFVKAVTYMPTKIGESPHNGTQRNWMFTDDNKNGKADSPYDSYLDKNRNDRRDPDEPAVGDFALLKEVGVNAIRIFHSPPGNTYNGAKEFRKEVLRDLFKTYGIRVIMGDFLGAYTVGSGADWNKGTDYRDKVQQDRMLANVRALVMDHKDEDYVLMWVLGNENNMSNQYGGVNATKTLAGAYPVEWAKFLNRVATMVHELDPRHPVMVGNLETQLIEYYNQYAPAIDILGVNSYRGKEGFGDLFYYVKRTFDRPVLITEYGSDVVHFHYNSVTDDDEESQRDYHQGTWRDIANNRCNGGQVGNCVGGIAFEWLDEWWKSNNGPWDAQDIARDSPMAFQDGWSSEDFFGIMSQGDGIDSPYLRRQRIVYDYYRTEWNKKTP